MESTHVRIPELPPRWIPPGVLGWIPEGVLGRMPEGTLKPSKEIVEKSQKDKLKKILTLGKNTVKTSEESIRGFCISKDNLDES